MRQLEPLPGDTQQLLLPAAAEPVGDVTLLRRAAELLGLEGDEAAPAEAAGLIDIGARVRFRHPLVRSAAYRAASVPDRRDVHRALAEATDQQLDPDRRAWHRAHAAARFDEAVADELERSAGRARNRGGIAAAVAFVERAAELTPDPAHRGRRALAAAQAKFEAGAPEAALELLTVAETCPLDQLQCARLAHLRAQIAFVFRRGPPRCPGWKSGRARRELLATGETVPRRTVDTPDDLTPQEALIARMASDGHSNPEIGAQLFISPRTVEYHLRKVFTKLGISSRKELRRGARDWAPRPRRLGTKRGTRPDEAGAAQAETRRMQITEQIRPYEVFPTWGRAQLEVERHAREAPLAPGVLRTTGFLAPEVAKRVTEWFLETPTAPTDAVRRSYRALERETARLYRLARRGLGVRVRYVRTESDPDGSAAELCADLREHGSMTLTALDEPHPLLEGRIVDQLRVVHDVFGHAALGVGFDLQSEFATWLQCRTLFSAEARPAAFCELVGAVTAYITTGEKPGLQAKLPPVELVQ